MDPQAWALCGKLTIEGCTKEPVSYGCPPTTSPAPCELYMPYCYPNPNPNLNPDPDRKSPHGSSHRPTCGPHALYTRLLIPILTPTLTLTLVPTLALTLSCPNCSLDTAPPVPQLQPNPWP